MIKNSQVACEYMKSKGFPIVSGGTDNHLFLVDMRPKGTDGARIEALLNDVLISINKNTVPGDKSPLNPSGIRLGSPAMTTRGCKENDFIEVMKLIEKATELAKKIGG